MARELWEDSNINPRGVDRRTLWQLQWSTDYFDAFWKGEWPPDARERAGIISRMRVPRWEPPRADPALGTPAADPVDASPRVAAARSKLQWPFGTDNTSVPERLATSRRPFFANTRTDDGSGREVEDDMRARLAALGIEVKRILGAGSQGLAVLVVYNAKNYVVKWGIDFEAMVVEMISMRQLVGARHIVQVCSPGAPVPRRLMSTVLGYCEPRGADIQEL